MRLKSLLAAVALIPICCADAFSDAITKLPPCGIACIVQSVPTSACQTVTNTTCLCSDRDLYDAVQNCVAAQCKPLEAITVAQIQADACQLPERSRKADLYAPASIEILAFICVLLRLYSRWYTTNGWEYDDYVMVFVALIYIPFVILGQYSGSLAFGVDVWTVPPENITLASKLFYIDESFYVAILALTKISILCFYLRIFPQRTFRQATLITIIWVAIAGILLVFLQIFQCIPISFNWEGWRGDFGPHKCLNINALAYAAAGTSIAQDIVILALPIPLLVSLNTSRRSKIGILFMFSLGVFILITSCIRLRYIIVFARSLNPTWDYTDSLIWSGVEGAVSVMVPSLPAIRVLLNRVKPGLFGTTFGSKKSSQATDFSSQGQGGFPRSNRSAQDRLFSMMARTSIRDSAESQLELGDKSKGAVHTEIFGGDDSSSSATRSRDGMSPRSQDITIDTRDRDSGIRVMQTMTTRSSIAGGRQDDVQ